MWIFYGGLPNFRASSDMPIKDIFDSAINHINLILSSLDDRGQQPHMTINVVPPTEEKCSYRPLVFDFGTMGTIGN